MLFPASSVTEDAGMPIVTLPADGAVMVHVHRVLETWVKLESVAPVTVMSVESNPVGGSLQSNVQVIGLLDDVPPFCTIEPSAAEPVVTQVRLVVS